MQDDLRAISDELEIYDAQAAKIIKNGPKETPYCVISKKGRNFGCYSTEKEAIKRLSFVYKLDFDENGVPDIKKTQKAEAFVKKVGPPEKPWCVITEQTGHNMGCYPTKKEAENRLEQIKRFG